MREVEFTIDDDGNIEVDLIGFDGKGCGTLGEKLAKALGSVKHRQQKQEFFKPVQKQKQKICRGM